MLINLLSLIFNIFGKRPVYCGPVQSFDNLGQWWTGLDLGPSKNGQKTGPDWTFKHYLKLAFNTSHLMMGKELEGDDGENGSKRCQMSCLDPR